MDLTPFSNREVIEMNDNHIGKYVITLVKANDVTVLVAFDNKEDAIQYGNTNYKKYKLKEHGIMCCSLRKYRIPDETLNIPNYKDEEIKTWFNLEEYMGI